jgi:hypothetical protein
MTTLPKSIHSGYLMLENLSGKMKNISLECDKWFYIARKKDWNLTDKEMAFWHKAVERSEECYKDILAVNDEITRLEQIRDKGNSNGS